MVHVYQLAFIQKACLKTLLLVQSHTIVLRMFFLSIQVVTNMNVAYRQEKKNSKRKARTMPFISLTVTDPLFSTEETPSAKKLKESFYMSFPVETVLTTVQNVPEAKKNGLEYPLTDSDVHWTSFLIWPFIKHCPQSVFA